jgi:hypothetical protein
VGDGLRTEVSAQDCHGRVATAAPAYLQHVERALDAARERPRSAPNVPAAPEATRPTPDRERPAWRDRGDRG